MTTTKKVEASTKLRTQKLKTFIDSGIDHNCAMRFINNFRQQNPNAPLLSVWIDRTIIDFIAQDETHAINGIRVYLAQYMADSGTNCLKDKTPGDITAILALTTQSDLTGQNIDLQTGYFDYGNPCPPRCEGDAGNHPSKSKRKPK